MIQALLFLGEIFPEEKPLKGKTYSQWAEGVLFRFYPQLEKSPWGMSELACTALMHYQGPIVLSGLLSGSDTGASINHAHIFNKPDSAPNKNGEIQFCRKNTCEMIQASELQSKLKSILTVL